MITACKERLVAKVPDLTAHRVSGAAEFNNLMQSGNIPQAPFFAFLIPSGLRGQDPSAMSGSFVQAYRETLGVVLGFRTNSASANEALPEIDAGISSVIYAFCGWAPDINNIPGVFQLVSGRVAGFNKGAVFYQLEFAINRQLRITP